MGFWPHPELVQNRAVPRSSMHPQPRGEMPSFSALCWDFMQFFAKTVCSAYDLRGVSMSHAVKMLYFHSRCKEVFKFSFCPGYLALVCVRWQLLTPDGPSGETAYERAWDTSNTNLGFQVVSQAQSSILWRFYSQQCHSSYSTINILHQLWTHKRDLQHTWVTG